MGKESTCNAGDTGDMGLIPGSVRSPGGGNGNPHPSILAWRIPWTEQPGGLQSMGVQRVRYSRVTKQQHDNVQINSTREYIKRTNEQI